MTGRRLAAMAGSAIFALAVLYGIAWFVIAGQFRDSIDRWVAQRRLEGWTVEHGEITTSGFPFSWRAHIENPRLDQSTGKPAFYWSGPWLDLIWLPWRPRIVAVRSSGAHRMALGTADESIASSVTMAAGRGRLTFAEQGGLEKLSLRIDGATIALPDGGSVKIDRLTGTIDGAPPAPQDAATKPHLKPAFRLDTRLQGVTLPDNSRPVLGRTIRSIAVRGTVLGWLAPGPIRQMMASWRDGGGTVEIERLELGWATLSVKATGTMALDSAMQPVGAMTAGITGYSKTMDRLVATGLVKPGQALLAKVALGAMAHTPAGGGTPEIRVPISVQGGWIYLGPIKLLPAPHIQWD